MADDLLIRISGDPSGFQAAVKQVQDGLGQLQTALKQQAAVNQQAGNSFTAALKQGIDAMQRERSELGYLTSASKLYGEEIAKQKLAWLQASQGADDYKLRLQSLNMELGLANDKLKMMGENSPTSGLGRLGQMFTSVAEGPIGGFTSKILGTLNPLNLFHSQVMRLVEVMGLWRMFEAGSRFISNFANQIASLPVTMERFQRSWTYTFGMNDPSVRNIADPTQRMAAASGVSRDLAAWSAQYSYNLPYTRQNMLQAISSLSMADLSAQGVKHYLPVLADLASTAGVGFGGQPVDLATAAYAVQGAMHGMTRMLRYDLKINPDDLKKYGYDQTNPDMLLPALEAYTKAKGRAGAARDMATNTFFGAKSSFEDRWQNLALDIGGYPAFGPQAGDLRKNSPFDVMRSGLVELNKYWDKHQDQLNKIGAFISETIGTGMHDAGRALLAFGDGLRSSGLAQMFGDSFMNLAKTLSDPAFARSVADLARTLGSVIGSNAQGLATGVGQVAGGVGDFWQAIGPEGRQGTLNAARLPGLGYQEGGGFIRSRLGMIGHGIHAVGNLFHGDVRGAISEGGESYISANAGAGDAYDAFMKFAGVDTHGQGHRDAIQFTGQVRENVDTFNRWFFGSDDTTSRSALRGGHRAHRGHTFLDMSGTGTPNRGVWGNFTDWWGQNVTPQNIGNEVTQGLGHVDLSQVVKGAQAVGQGLSTAWTAITKFFGGFPDFFKGLWPSLTKSGHDMMAKLSDAITSGTDTVKKAIGNLWQNALTALGSIHFPWQSNSTAKHASGGLMSAGGFSWVGEQGPELVYLPGGAQVYNAQQSTTMGASLGAGGGSLAGGGGTVINISGVGLMDILTLIDMYTAGGERQSDLTARRAGGTRRFVG